MHREGTGCVEVAEGIVDGLAAVEEEVHAARRGGVGGRVGVWVVEWGLHVDVDRGGEGAMGGNWNCSLIERERGLV